MPYVTKGKCVYKKDTGKKVGCTKGSVKKYLTALRMNVNESEDLEWAQDIVNTESVDITKNRKEIGSLKKGSVISITGFWESLTFDNDKATIVEFNDSLNVLLKFDRIIESEDDRTHCGETKENNIECGCKNANKRNEDGIGKCWWTSIPAMDKVIWYPYELNETLNESEEDEFDWVPNEVDLNDHRVLFTIIEDTLKNTNFKIVKVGKIYHIEDEFGDVYFYIPETDFNLPFIYHEIKDGIQFLTFEDDTEMLPYYQKLMGLLRPLYKNNIDKLFKPIKESEDDELEWAFDMVKQNPLEFHGMELMIDVDDLTENERAYFLALLHPYIDKGLDGAENSGDWSWDCLIKKNKVKTISLHCGIEDNDYVPQRGRVCCLSYRFGDEKEVNPHLIIPLNARDIISNHKSNLTESEDDDLEWAKDIVDNIDNEIDLTTYEQELSSDEYESRINQQDNLPLGSVLRISGYQDDLDFIDEEVVVVGGNRAGTEKLVLFNRIVELAGDGDYYYTHCGGANDDYKDICRCEPETTDENGDFLVDDKGRCWYVKLDSQEEVILLTNRRDIMSESKKPLLTEGRYDSITRKVVKDIMTVISQSSQEVGLLTDTTLPNDLREDEEEYIQEGMAFAVEFNVQREPLTGEEYKDGFVVNSATADDDENIIMITVYIDPKSEPQSYQKLFYKLQEDVRHEIEHFTQSGEYRIEDRPTSKTNTANLKTVYGHHKHKVEIPALVHGFYRRAKLEKRPLDDVMTDDLDSEIERGNISKKQAEKLLTMWVDYAKKNLPKAIYSKE